MRKLILTSFTARIKGGNDNDLVTEPRIVVIESDKRNSHDDDRELAAETLRNWFHKTYKNCDLIAILPHETVEQELKKDPSRVSVSKVFQEEDDYGDMVEWFHKNMDLTHLPTDGHPAGIKTVIKSKYKITITKII